MGRDEATFYTLATAAYFPGAAALLNSLRLTGNDWPLVVVDGGLTDRQRAQLAPHAAVVEIPEQEALGPYIGKPYAATLQESGVAVLIDSDMLVTRSLEPYLALARDGALCLFADHISARGRSREEWRDALALRAPLRPRTYMNAGFVCLPVEQHRDLLMRWLELAALIPAEQGFTTPEAPFYALEQDVLNALLASEFADAQTVELRDGEEVFWDELAAVEVVDPATLECRFRGSAPAILHYSFQPKPWETWAWLRVSDDAFVRLLPRVLFGDDVPLRLDEGDVPLWLRDDRTGRLALRTLSAVHNGVKAAIDATPDPVAGGVRRGRDALVRRFAR